MVARWLRPELRGPLRQPWGMDILAITKLGCKVPPVCKGRGKVQTENSEEKYTLYSVRYSIPCTFYFTSYTLYVIPYTLYLIRYILRRVPYTAYLIPHTVYRIPYTAYLIPHTLRLMPYTLYLTPCIYYCHSRKPPNT